MGPILERFADTGDSLPVFTAVDLTCAAKLFKRSTSRGPDLIHSRWVLLISPGLLRGLRRSLMPSKTTVGGPTSRRRPMRSSSRSLTVVCDRSCCISASTGSVPWRGCPWSGRGTRSRGPRVWWGDRDKVIERYVWLQALLCEMVRSNKVTAVTFASDFSKFSVYINHAKLFSKVQGVGYLYASWGRTWAPAQVS